MASPSSSSAGNFSPSHTPYVPGLNPSLTKKGVAVFTALNPQEEGAPVAKTADIAFRLFLDAGGTRKDLERIGCALKAENGEGSSEGLEAFDFTLSANWESPEGCLHKAVVEDLASQLQSLQNKRDQEKKLEDPDPKGKGPEKKPGAADPKGKEPEDKAFELSAEQKALVETYCLRGGAGLSREADSNDLEVQVINPMDIGKVESFLPESLPSEIREKAQAHLEQVHSYMASVTNKEYLRLLIKNDDKAAIRHFIQCGGSPKALALVMEDSIRESLLQVFEDKESDKESEVKNQLRVRVRGYAKLLQYALEVQYELFDAPDAPNKSTRRRIFRAVSHFFGFNDSRYCRELIVLMGAGDTTQSNFLAQGGSLKSAKKHADTLRLDSTSTFLQRLARRFTGQERAAGSVSYAEEFLDTSIGGIKNLQKKAEEKKKAEHVLLSEGSLVVTNYIHRGGDIGALAGLISGQLSYGEQISGDYSTGIVPLKDGKLNEYCMLNDKERELFRENYLDKLGKAIEVAEKDHWVRHSFGGNKARLLYAKNIFKNTGDLLDFVDALLDAGWTRDEVITLTQALNGNIDILAKMPDTKRLRDHKELLLEQAQLITKLRPLHKGAEGAQERKKLQEGLVSIYEEKQCDFGEYRDKEEDLLAFTDLIKKTERESFRDKLDEARKLIDQLTPQSQESQGEASEKDPLFASFARKGDLIDSKAVSALIKGKVEAILAETIPTKDQEVKLKPFKEIECDFVAMYLMQKRSEGELDASDRAVLERLREEFKNIKINPANAYFIVHFFLEDLQQEDKDVREKVFEIIEKDDSLKALSSEAQAYFDFCSENGFDRIPTREDLNPELTILEHQQEELATVLTYKLSSLRADAVKKFFMLQHRAFQCENKPSKDRTEFMLKCREFFKLHRRMSQVQNKLDPLTISEDGELNQEVSKIEKSRSEIKESSVSFVREFGIYIRGNKKYEAIYQSLSSIHTKMEANKDLSEEEVEQLKQKIKNDCLLAWEEEIGYTAQSLLDQIDIYCRAKQKMDRLAKVTSSAKKHIKNIGNAEDLAADTLLKLGESNQEIKNHLLKVKELQLYCKQKGLGVTFSGQKSTDEILSDDNYIEEQLDYLESIILAEKSLGEEDQKRLELIEAKIQFHKAYLALATRNCSKPSSEAFIAMRQLTLQGKAVGDLEGRGFGPLSVEDWGRLATLLEGEHGEVVKEELDTISALYFSPNTSVDSLNRLEERKQEIQNRINKLKEEGQEDQEKELKLQAQLLGIVRRIEAPENKRIEARKKLFNLLSEDFVAGESVGWRHEAEHRKTELKGFGYSSEENANNPKATVHRRTYRSTEAPRSEVKAESFESLRDKGKLTKLPLNTSERTVVGKKAYHKQDYRSAGSYHGLSPYASNTEKGEFLYKRSVDESFISMAAPGKEHSLEGIMRAFKAVYLAEVGPTDVNSLKVADTYIMGLFQDWLNDLPRRFEKKEFIASDLELTEKLKQDLISHISHSSALSSAIFGREKGPTKTLTFDRKLFADVAGPRVGAGGDKPHQEIAANGKVFGPLIEDYNSGKWKEGQTRTVTYSLLAETLNDKGEIDKTKEQPKERVIKGLNKVFEARGCQEAFAYLNPSNEKAEFALCEEGGSVEEYIEKGGSYSTLVDVARSLLESYEQNLTTTSSQPSLRQLVKLDTMVSRLKAVVDKNSESRESRGWSFFQTSPTESELTSMEFCIGKHAEHRHSINSLLYGSIQDVEDFILGEIAIGKVESSRLFRLKQFVEQAQTHLKHPVGKEPTSEREGWALLLGRHKIVKRNLECAMQMVKPSALEGSLREVSESYNECIKLLDRQILEAQLHLISLEAAYRYGELEALEEEYKDCKGKETDKQYIKQKGIIQSFNPAAALVELIQKGQKGEGPEVSLEQALSVIEGVEHAIFSSKQAKEKPSDWLKEMQQLKAMTLRVGELYGKIDSSSKRAELPKKFRDYLHDINHLEKVLTECKGGASAIDQVDSVLRQIRNNPEAKKKLIAENLWSIPNVIEKSIR